MLYLTADADSGSDDFMADDAWVIGGTLSVQSLVFLI